MKDFFSNIKLEFKKITWPTSKELKLNTLQVFVFIVILSFFFFVVDTTITAGLAVLNHTPDPITEVYEDDDYSEDEVLEADEAYSENDDEE